MTKYIALLRGITVGIITADELREALARAPEWWGDDPDAKFRQRGLGTSA